MFFSQAEQGTRAETERKNTGKPLTITVRRKRIETWFKGREEMRRRRTLYIFQLEGG